MTPDLHPNVRPLEFLLGAWRGRGRGDYPTIEGFEYEEESTYGHVGKPFLAYSQRTRDSAGLPLHAEVGYLRATGGDRLELVLAHPFGITEILTGVISGNSLHLETTSVEGTPTAKEVRSLRRLIEVTGDQMRYRIDMAAVGQPLQFHLEATLTRQTDGTPAP